MGYHITLSRPKPNSAITAQEWKDFVFSRSELKIVAEDTQFITAILQGDDNLALHYSMGSSSVFTKNPQGPQIIEYMASIAPYFGGIVTGDEGETFASQADWGTQSNWDSRPDAEASRRSACKPWWKHELSKGKRLIVGLLLGVFIVIIHEAFLK